MPSKALEINLECTRVDVTIGERYTVLQEVMAIYPGMMQGVEAFLKEVCHPLRNWAFILQQARGYALDYFHVVKAHPRGTEAAEVFVDLFLEGFEGSRDAGDRADAAGNLLLYLQKILRDSGEDLSRFLPVLEGAFKKIGCYEGDDLLLFLRSFYQIGHMAGLYREKVPAGRDLTALNVLVAKGLQASHAYWLSREDPGAWFLRVIGHSPAGDTGVEEILHPLSHATLRGQAGELEAALEEHDIGSRALLDDLLELPGYGQMVDVYRGVPQRLLQAGEGPGRGSRWKLLFLFHIMPISGLSAIHEETLREIHRTLVRVMDHEGLRDAEELLKETFGILDQTIRDYPLTALSCLGGVGKVVYARGDRRLVEAFQDAVIGLGFQYPDLGGYGDDWKIRVNEAHVRNIRTWMELIEQRPSWSRKLLSALILHLSLGGVLVRDTDLFPRDISRFLNSDIAPVYQLAKDLMRLFPTYFNEVGAEGVLRDLSTRIDEACLRKDPLVHFLRKQSHVESSNQIIGLMEGILTFWRTREKAGLEPFLPPALYSEIETDGPYINGVHRVLAAVFRSRNLGETADLLLLKEDDVRGAAGGISGTAEVDLERVVLAVRLYARLYTKYRLSPLEIERYLEGFQDAAFPGLAEIRKGIKAPHLRVKLGRILAGLEKLKELILSPEQFEPREDIYHKRHIAVDIPSMYGSYHERKFDALGLTFRLESLVNILFGELVEGTDLRLITRAGFSKIHDYLKLFYRALQLDGITSRAFETQLDLLAHSLKVRGFSFTQFADIFKGLVQAVGHIVTDTFTDLHRESVESVVAHTPEGARTPSPGLQQVREDPEKGGHRVLEVFARERIAAALGLQQLDGFLTRVMHTLQEQSRVLKEERMGLLLNYDPEKALTPLHPVKKKIADIIHLGNKGLNLVRLKQLGCPVPAGFILSTEVFRYRSVIEDYPPPLENLRERMARQVTRLEKQTGKRFGDPHNPLLLSVRSGAAVSQPGMMDTFLNVGINEAVVDGLVARTGESRFAWDCYRRYIQALGMAGGVDRDAFDDAMMSLKERWGVADKGAFTGDQMEAVTRAYRELVEDHGVRIETSPQEQLFKAVMMVFGSWDSAKAASYRRIMGISDDWGTAVTVQQMVYGNLGARSGSGVIFTHSPRFPGNRIRPWGDITLGNQGEDVVSGLVTTSPVSKKQAEIENREGGVCLETDFPEIYHTIKTHVEDLIIKHAWGPQEMEFTFESPGKEDFYFLQSRDMAIRETRTLFSFVPEEEDESRLLCRGIGVSGGAMTGRLVYNLDEIRRWRETEPDTSLILVRGDTVPDDINEIHEADGLLTARGGSTSHAAVVAHRLGKTCVVGCEALVCLEKEQQCYFRDVRLEAGEWVSLDGRKGSIYAGKMKIRAL